MAKEETITLNYFLHQVLNDAEKYLNDTEDKTIIESIIKILKDKTYEGKSIFSDEGLIETATIDMSKSPLFKNITEITGDKLIKTENIKGSIVNNIINQLNLPYAKSASTKRYEEAKYNEIVSKIKSENPSIEIHEHKKNDSVEDSTTIYINGDIKNIKLPEGVTYYEPSRKLIIDGSSITISVKNLSEAKEEDLKEEIDLSDNIIEIKPFNSDEITKEKYEEYLIEEYNKVGYRVEIANIRGLPIRAAYPHELGLSKIKLNDENYSIKGNGKDYYKEYINEVKEIIIKNTPTVEGNLIEDLKEVKDKDTFLVDDIDIEEIITSLETYKNEDNKDYTISLVNSSIHPALIGKIYEIKANETNINDILTKISPLTNNINIHKNIRLDNNNTIFIRKKLPNESIESYEKEIENIYLRAGHKTKKINGIRNLYPHEANMKYKDDKYIIKYEDGLNAKECKKYYLDNIIEPNKLAQPHQIIGKNQFINDISRIKNKMDTLLPKFSIVNINKLISILREDKVAESSNEECYNLTIPGDNFIHTLNKDYIFKVSKETMLKLENMHILEKYFNGYKKEISKKPLETSIQIRKRKNSESIIDYEKYLEETYKSYPEVIEKDDKGVRKKLPHEKGLMKFVANGNEISINYGDPTNTEDINEYNTNKNKYIKEVRDFYITYYNNMVPLNTSLTPKRYKKSDFLEILRKIKTDPNNLIISDIDNSEINQIINALNNDNSDPSLNENKQQIEIPGDNIIGQRDSLFIINVNEETYNKIAPLLTKYFGNRVKLKLKNKNKNLYLKKELEKELNNLENSEENRNKRELIEKAIRLLSFDIEDDTEKTELLGAIIQTDNKEEFLKTMRDLEKLDVTFQNFVPLETPRKKNENESARDYEKYLEKHYKKARPEFFSTISEDYIYNDDSSRKPYPHEIFEWDINDNPSINPKNTDNEFYQYYATQGKLAKTGKRKVSDVKNLKEHPELQKGFKNAIKRFFMKNDIVKAYARYNENFRDLELSRTSFDSWWELTKKVAIVSGTLAVFTAAGITIPVVGAVGVGTAIKATIGIPIATRIVIGDLPKIFKHYQMVKRDRLINYSKTLQERKKDIKKRKKEVEEAINGNIIPKEQIRIMHDNLKDSIADYIKTEVKFIEAYRKANRALLEEFSDVQQEVESFDDEIEEIKGMSI